MTRRSGWQDTVALPVGVEATEALSFLELLARLKARRFGRLVVTVRDGRIMDVEMLEKIDRAVLRDVSS